MQKIRKAIMPVAGFGTRFLPATKAQPKEMLPIVDKPVVQFLVEEAVASGIKEIIFVTGSGKRAIEDHFDSMPLLEETLNKKGKKKELKLVQEVSDIAKISYVRQKEPRGDGDAIRSALHLVGDEPVAILFGDDLVFSEKPCLSQMMDIYEKRKAPVIALEKVPKSMVSSYGIVDGEKTDAGEFRISSFVEKPSPEEAPTRLGVIGKYIVTPELLHILRSLPYPKKGELRLADAFTESLKKGNEVNGLIFSGERYDCGSKLGFVQATIAYGLKHPEIAKDLKKYLRSNF
ncbi:MAG: UTP--glucose-1-phosphate uridylyltransferase GalU [Candidatus Paceibacterota bacterium]